jgi:predicted site-specific integrase-resolvase
MRISRSLISSASFCRRCRKNTNFAPVQFACAQGGVSRSTIYYWMERGWIHWLEKPNGRRVICLESLSLRAPKSTLTLVPTRKVLARVSDTVRKCPTL